MALYLLTFRGKVVEQPCPSFLFLDMRNVILGVALWLLSFVAAMAQKPAYFNTRKSLGYLATVFTGVYPTDSCVYIKGVMVDSLLRFGSFFSKADLSGHFVWTIELVEPGKDFNWWDGKLIQNNRGNFVLSGVLKEPEISVFVAEINPSGHMVDYKKFKSPFYPVAQYIVPRAMIALKDGGYALTGILEGTSQQKQNVFLLKLTDSLSVEWYKLFGLTGLRKNGISLLSDNFGNFLIGGMEFNSLIDKGIICRRYILKVDSTGENVLFDWKHPKEGLPSIRGWAVNDMILLPDGSVVGASSISKEKPINAETSFLYVYPSFFKLNPDQTLAWERPVGNQRWSDIGNTVVRIAPAQDGNGYVGTGVLGIWGTDAAPYKDLGFIAKVSDTGDSLWMRYLYFFQDSSSMYFHSVVDLVPAPDGGYWLCGEIQRQLPDEPLQQGWLLRVDNYGCLSPGCQLVSASESPVEDKISIYPNPAFNYIVVHHGGYTFQKGHFSILNQQGQVVRDWVAPMDDVSTVFDVSRFPAGAYVLQYREAGGLMVVKSFVVQR